MLAFDGARLGGLALGGAVRARHGQEAHAPSMTLWGDLLPRSSVLRQQSGFRLTVPRQQTRPAGRHGWAFVTGNWLLWSLTDQLGINVQDLFVAVTTNSALCSPRPIRSERILAAAY
jgi:hypothetical protein